jgi:hypothetical protein
MEEKTISSNFYLFGTAEKNALLLISQYDEAIKEIKSFYGMHMRTLLG